MSFSQQSVKGPLATSSPVWMFGGGAGPPSAHHQRSTVVQSYDRSPICTLALADYLGHPVSDALIAEIDRIGRTRA